MIIVKTYNKDMLNDTVYEMEQNLEFIQKFAKDTLKENIDYKKNIEHWNSSKKWVRNRIERNIFNLTSIIGKTKWYLKRRNIKVLDNSYSFLLNSKYNMQVNEVENCKDENKLIEPYQELETMVGMLPIMAYSSVIPLSIATNTIKYSIELDLGNDMHLNIENLLELYFNIKEPSMLIDFIPNMRRMVKEQMLSTINYVPSFQTKKTVFDTILKLSDEENYICSNILIMPLIESLTKDFLKEVYKNQNPNLNEEEIDKEIFYKYISLIELIDGINLLSDYPITYSEARYKYCDSSNPIIVNAVDKFSRNENLRFKLIDFFKEAQTIYENEGLLCKEKNDEMTTLLKNKAPLNKNGLPLNFKEEDIIRDFDELIYIPINARLEFLKRKMYEDRNQILHGRFDKIEPWKHYLYLSGLFKLLRVVEDYYTKRKPN